MRILPINNVCTYNKPTFRSISFAYRLPNNDVMGTTTWMFREDVDWLKLAQFELENFKKKDKVNIIQFAPSDGSEGYTKILSHLITNPHEAEKFFPIKAYDINERVVAGANTNLLNLSGFDIKNLIEKGINIIRNFPGAMEFYQQLKKEDLSLNNTSVFQVSEELTKRINFNHGDMFKILPSIKDESNTILMARNCLGYYSDATVRNFIQNASKVLKKGSLFIVGQLEYSNYFDAILNQNSFFPVMKNVYRKVR